MKSCPVCHARAFDDAEVCYGCLHRFADAAAPGWAPAGEAGWEPDGAVGAPCADPRPADAGGRAEPRAGKHALAREGECRDGAEPAEKVCGSAAALQRPRAVRRSEAVSQHASAAQAVSSEAPFDQAGWIVRFELPGTAGQSSAAADARASASRGGADRPSQLGGRHDPASPCSLVVSICPARGGSLGADALDDGRIVFGSVPSEGRAVPAAQASLAALAGEGGRR